MRVSFGLIVSKLPPQDQQPPSRDPAGDPDIVSLQLKMARLAADLSVMELSRLTGISKTVLHGYERGRTKPGARELRILSAALKVSPNMLLLGSEDFEGTRPDLTSIFRKLRARPELSGVFLTSLMPFLSPALDEAEFEGLLVLLHGLLRSRSPELAARALEATQQVARWVDEHTLPDGSFALQGGPEALQTAISEFAAQADAAVEEATKQAD